MRAARVTRVLVLARPASGSTAVAPSHTSVKCACYSRYIAFYEVCADLIVRDSHTGLDASSAQLTSHNDSVEA
jgi:hypothetical protein